ncbi:MAG: transposase [Candidatus Accumulibacter similis]|nr:MAG: transposase [Candidatus Accumulibacter similis]
MKQISFFQGEFAGKNRTARREVFLAEMEQVMPWGEVLGVIAPHYPKGKRDRLPVGLERMLRAYLVQQWYSLSDEGAVDEITVKQGAARDCRDRPVSGIGTGCDDLAFVSPSTGEA